MEDIKFIEVEVHRMFSKIWLTTESPKQKYQHRDDIIKYTKDAINNHPDTALLKKILHNDDCFLLNLSYEIVNPTPEGVEASRNYSIVYCWYLTDLTNHLNVTPILKRHGFPECAFEVIDNDSLSDKLNNIISDTIFSAKGKLKEYEIRIGEVFQEI